MAEASPRLLALVAAATDAGAATAKWAFACDNLETQQKKTRLRRAPARQAKKTKIEIGLSSFIRHSPAAP